MGVKITYFSGTQYDTVLSNKRTTKALIRLCDCADTKTQISLYAAAFVIRLMESIISRLAPTERLAGWLESHTVRKSGTQGFLNQFFNSVHRFVR